MKAEKEIIETESRILNPDSGFKAKSLCTGPTFTAGTACVFSCTYCYVPTMMRKTTKDMLAGKDFQSVIIRRRNAVEKLRQELHDSKGRPKYADEKGVIYGSPLVDIAATEELAEETLEICKVLLSSTGWDIRLLSKSYLIENIADEIPAKFKGRVIFGLSTGTLDDSVAEAIEPDAPLPSDRLATLRRLQRDGYRTFAMLCPILPQDVNSYATLVQKRIDLAQCEHVWAEVLNRRGDNFVRLGAALCAAKLDHWAEELDKVSTDAEWENYAKQVFDSLKTIVPRNPHEPKLRFLQYQTKDTTPSWLREQENGAILLREISPAASGMAMAGTPTGTASLTSPVSPTQASTDAQKLRRQLAAKKAWVTIRANQAAKADAEAKVKAGASEAGGPKPSLPTQN